MAGSDYENVQEKAPQTKDTVQPQKHAQSQHVSDHLANERTFLAWLRTGIATIAFGFVVARFGLLLRELNVKGESVVTGHYSSLIGVTLTTFGIMIMLVALFNFLHKRRMIDAEQFRPMLVFPILLTILTALIGVLLAIYLLITA